MRKGEDDENGNDGQDAGVFKYKAEGNGMVIKPPPTPALPFFFRFFFLCVGYSSFSLM